jgi:outer membrane protein OmpA-like peptidoglycan-associated protein
MLKQLATMGLVIITAAGCTSPGKRTAVGAGAGAAGGAAVGAGLGAIAGNAGKGAWIGAAAGSVIGTVIGNHMDKQAKELEKIAETRRTEDGIITKLKNDLLFPFDSADLKPQAKQDIAQISEIIKKYPENRLTIVGYTDDKGSEIYNQSLSERRARSVKLAMVNSGVDPTIIETLGQGEANPVASNTSNDGRAKNRRVELQITADPSKVQTK